MLPSADAMPPSADAMLPVGRIAMLAGGLACFAGAMACSGPQASASVGAGEPIRVESGQFVPGGLPGISDDASSGDAAAENPQVTDLDIPNTILAQGQGGVPISGHATPDAQTVAVRFADLGSGYWVVPVGAPDPSDNGQLTWSFVADFGSGLPTGDHDLLLAAIAAGGASGLQFDLPVCVDTPVPDNLNACVPDRAPPAAVLSLDWDTPVDLDLLVQTPTGAFVGSGAAATGQDGGSGATGAVVDRNSNANCAIDGIQREDIVWQAPPPRGVYEVWVDLFSACDQPAVTFTVSLWLAQAQPDGTERLVEQQPPLATGELLAVQANGGAEPGLYVGDFVFR